MSHSRNAGISSKPGVGSVKTLLGSALRSPIDEMPSGAGNWRDEWVSLRASSEGRMGALLVMRLSV